MGKSSAGLARVVSLRDYKRGLAEKDQVERLETIRSLIEQCQIECEALGSHHKKRQLKECFNFAQEMIELARQ